jgi:transposase-like protein
VDLEHLTSDKDCIFLAKGAIDMPAKRKNFEDAVAMYNAGFSVAEVAKAYGQRRNSLYAALKRRNVVFRSQQRWGEDNHFFKGGYPYDKRVHAIVAKAICRGKLIQQPCEVCGDNSKQKHGRSSIHAHHDDYNKPLEVRWLCDPCHREWHLHHEPIRRVVELPKMDRREIAALGGKTSWAKRPVESLKNLEFARRMCRGAA